MRKSSTSLILALAVTACGTDKVGGPAATSTELVAKGFKGELPKTDPDAAAWSKAPEQIVKLMLQDQAPPKLDQPGVESLRVRALQDGKWIAFRLEWDDPTVNDLVGPARFGDMVAIQLPTEAGPGVPDAAMGQSGRIVRIHLWKAVNQRRMAADGADPIPLLYPNALSDHYPPSAAPAGPTADAMALQYSPAKGANNLVTLRRTDSPTEDLVAEGFGSLTAVTDQTSLGRGVHDGTRWRVTIARPLDRQQGEPLVASGRTYAAFAVWQGSAGNVGSRKMRSGWVPLSIEAAP